MNRGKHVFQKTKDKMKDLWSKREEMAKNWTNDVTKTWDKFEGSLAKAHQDTLKTLAELFKCSGQMSAGYSYGYGFKLPPLPYEGPWGIAFAIGLTLDGTGPLAGIAALVTKEASGARRRYQSGVGMTLALSVVFGFTPGSAETGGIRIGLGISAGISCNTGTVNPDRKPDCHLGIKLGNMNSVIFPSEGCLGPPTLGPAACFFAYGFTVTILCCSYWMILGEGDCR